MPVDSSICHIILIFFWMLFRRNLGYYSFCHEDAVWACDIGSDGNPELVIKIPRNTYDLSMMLGESLCRYT